MKTHAGRRQAMRPSGVRLKPTSGKALAKTKVKPRPQVAPTPVTPGAKHTALTPDTRARLAPQERATERARATGRRQRWVADGDPCPICQALDGSTVGPAGQFPRVAPVSEKSWWNTHARPGPPAHPNCKCELEEA